MTNSLPAAADDDEDDDNIAQSEIREILRSLTRRMVKSDLEDFELVKICYFTSFSSSNKTLCISHM